MNELFIPAAILEKIVYQAEVAFPAECCGLLAGHDIHGVSAMTPLENISATDGEFRTSDAEFHARGAELIADGHTILGVYHSHSNSVLLPSGADLDGMTFSGIMLIAAKSPDGTAFAAYRVNDGEATLVPIHSPCAGDLSGSLKTPLPTPS